MTDIPDYVRRAREKWKQFAHSRPEKLEEPGPGQESVWDYPRPPRVESVVKPVRVEFAGSVLARSSRAFRVLETASPPTYYLPPDDVRMEYLEPSTHRSLCEWKGRAQYFSPRIGNRIVRNAAWCYPEPWEGFADIAHYVAFMPGAMDACYVGEDKVRPQPGGFYGGWITPDIVGPFKGQPGTEHW